MSITKTRGPRHVTARPSPAPAVPPGAALPREKLNVRFLAWLLGGAVLVGAAWYGLHAWQVRNHLAVLLAQADAAEAQQRPDRAARLVGLYVGMAPDDVEARARYGMLLDRLAETPKARADAAAVLEQVLLRDPDRHAIRRRLAQLDLEAGAYDDALEHLTHLHEALPDDAEVEEMLGRCLEGRGQYSKAVDQYEAALKREPDRAECCGRLSRLLRDRMSQPGKAIDRLNTLVEKAPKSYKAWLTRAAFLQEASPSADSLKKAGDDVAEALKLEPDRTEVLLAAARLAEKRPDGRDEARGYLGTILEKHPQDVRGYTALAALELGAGRPKEAMDALRLGLDGCPTTRTFCGTWPAWRLSRGRPTRGNSLAARLAKLGTPAPRLDFLHAALHLRRGEWSDAARELEGVRPLLADSAELTVQCDLLLARCYGALGDLDAQVLVCRRVSALDPRQTDARLTLATALFKLGRGAEALEECQHLTGLPQPPVEGWLLMARLLILQNLRLPADHRQWDRVETVLKAAGDAAEVPLLRAEVLADQNNTAEARRLLEAARDKDPARDDLWFALADLYASEGKKADALRTLDEAGRRLGDSAGLRLARLRCLTAGEGSAGAKDLAPIEEGLDRLPEEDQVGVLKGLAERTPGGARRPMPADCGPRRRDSDPTTWTCACGCSTWGSRMGTSLS